MIRHNSIEDLYVCIFRFLKKTITKLLLSPQNLDAIQSLRMRKLEELESLVNQFCQRGKAIDLARASFVTSFNIISNALFSVDLATYDSDTSSYEFHNTVVHLMEISGKPNVGDYFQYMRFLDLQGTRKEAVLCMERLFRVFQEFIDARLAKRLSQAETEASSIDMLDSLLDLTQQNEAELTMNDIKHLLLVSLSQIPIKILLGCSIINEPLFVTGCVCCWHRYKL